jgi:drug/metabolite transporter (DMT)-like permease
MSLVALLLVVSAAFIHATWNLMAKKAAGGAAFVWLYGVGTTVLYLPVVVFVMIADPTPITLPQAGIIVASAFVHLLYSLSLQRGYQVADLSVVYPLARGTGPMLATVGAVVILGERPSLLGMLGAALIVGGVFLIAGGPRIFTRHDPAVRRGIFHGVLTGLLIACYTVLDGFGVKVLLVAPVVLDYFGCVLRMLFLCPLVLRQRDAVREQWQRHRRHALGVAALSPLSYILVLVAMKTTPVSYVAPARELSMMVAAFFGVRLLKEPDAVLRISGAALIAGGVIALALG